PIRTVTTPVRATRRAPPLRRAPTPARHPTAIPRFPPATTGQARHVARQPVPEGGKLERSRPFRTQGQALGTVYGSPALGRPAGAVHGSLTLCTGSTPCTVRTYHVNVVTQPAAAGAPPRRACRGAPAARRSPRRPSEHGPAIRLLTDI